MEKDTVYKQRAGGIWEYWTYSDGRTVYLQESTVNRWLARGTARIILVK